MRGPLDGIRVIEMGHALAGPFAATLLGDFGADVIKIERPHHGDSLRGMGPKFEGSGVWWSVTGRNKRSACIDVKQPAGRELILGLAEDADVLVENFRPGVMERLKLGWDDVSTQFPRLIMLRISGFGQSGPYSERAGFGKIAEAFSGATFLTGDVDHEPLHPGYSLGDATTGLMGAFGVMLALHDRQRSGRGQLVDLALYEPLFRMIEWQVPLHKLLDYTPGRNGTNFPFPGAFVTDICHTKDGHSLVVSAATTEAMTRLRAFVVSEERMRADESELDLVRGLRGWISDHNQDEALIRLESEGLVVGSIYSAADIANDPHVQARANIVQVPNENGTELPMPAVLPSLSETPGEVRWPGPQLGEHTIEVLTEVLGLTSERCEALVEDGVIATNTPRTFVDAREY